MKIQNLKLIIAILFLLPFVGCNSNRIYNETVTIPDNVWNKENKLKFSVAVQQIDIPYKLDVTVRHSEQYSSKNLWLFISTTTPSGKTQIDTLECQLADDIGKWQGDGAGDIWDVNIPFKKKIGFPEAGTYSIEIEQGMRTPQLPYIMEIGLQVEKLE